MRLNTCRTLQNQPLIKRTCKKLLKIWNLELQWKNDRRWIQLFWQKKKSPLTAWENSDKCNFLTTTKKSKGILIDVDKFYSGQSVLILFEGKLISAKNLIKMNNLRVVNNYELLWAWDFQIAHLIVDDNIEISQILSII